MSTVTFDTLKFADIPKQAGVPPAQAEAETRAIAATIGEVDVATKCDIAGVLIANPRFFAKMHARLNSN